MVGLAVAIVGALGLASTSLAADGTGASPPQIAASLSGATDGPAAARDQIVKEAVDALQQSQAKGNGNVPARPWHEMAWLSSGRGKVGRLYDLCTGAVEPPPSLSIGSWSWETLDPRGLSPEDRHKLTAWQSQQVIAQYGCGTVFVIGALSGDARSRLRNCPAPPADRGGARDVKAFIAHVHRNPALRASDDLIGVLVAALRAEGCS